MFKDMKLSTKLLVTFLLIGIIPVAACAWVAIAKSSAALSKQSYGQLEAIRAIKASQIQDYFKAMRTQLKVLKGDEYVRKALVDMDAAFEASGKKTDTPEWQDQAARYDARLKGIMEGYGWYDIFLIHDDGDIVYTVTREPDLGMVIPESKLRDEGLGKAFTRAHAMGNDDIAMSDFSPYSPSNGAPAAFMMARIADESGKLMGFIAFQIPLDHINAIMKQRDGMGETGESYLVGPDKLMRSDSFLDPVHHTVKASFADPSKGSVNTEAVTEALAGKTDQKIVLDYNGNPVLSAYMPLDVGGVTWALLVDIDESEAFAAVTAMEWIMGVIAVVSVSIILVVAWLVTRSVTVPINRAIGELNTGADQVASAATEVSSSSQTLAQGSSEQAASIEETSSSLEEMSAMTKQNASNAGEADSLMRDANQVVDEANGSMTELTTAMNGIEKASEETSKIIKTIDEIAFQTNLLALNAAVEAARAGEAGAGFAVVADEVRNLAMRAADAAKNTAELIEGTVKQIGDGNTLVGRTSEAFGRVSDSAGKVGELVSEIAAASSEQSQGISQVNTAVTEMEKVTQQNAASAEESASAAEEMTAQAEQMKAVVNQLVGLIHGRAQQPGSVAPRAKRSAPAKRPQKALAPAPAVTAPAVQSTAAEKLIPLDDDDSFSDF